MMERQPAIEEVWAENCGTSIFETRLRLILKPAICNFLAITDCDQPRA